MKNTVSEKEHQPAEKAEIAGSDSQESDKKTVTEDSKVGVGAVTYLRKRAAEIELTELE